MATKTCEFGTIVDHQKGRYQCNYCGKVVSGIHRLKCHLGGVSGGVTHCLQVPFDVKEMLRTELLGERFGNAMRNVGELNEPNLPLKRNRQDSPARLDKQDSIQNSGNVIAPVVPRGRVDSPAEGSGVGVNDSSLRKAQKSIGSVLIEFDCCCICLKEEGFICLVTFFSDPEVSCDLCCCIIRWNWNALDDKLSEEEKDTLNYNVVVEACDERRIVSTFFAAALKLKKCGRRSSLTPTKDGGTRLSNRRWWNSIDFNSWIKRNIKGEIKDSSKHNWGAFFISTIWWLRRWMNNGIFRGKELGLGACITLIILLKVKLGLST
nr:uncharacterized protein LOC109192332 isoform X2 [Ipomoea batatas]